MAIFFPCLCGQPLRVDEERAGDHALCPACGRLVRAPSLQRANSALGLTTPAADEPEPAPVIPPVPVARLTLVEETTLRPSRCADDEEDTPTYRMAEGDERSDKERKQLEREKVARWMAAARADLAEPPFGLRAWPLERAWYECLVYPLRAWWSVLILATVWATALAIALLPPPDGWTLRDAVMRFPWGVILFFLFGYTCAWLRATFAAAMEGRAGFIAWPENPPLLTLRSGAEAVLSFFAGPVVLFAVAFCFWFNSGELEWVDQLILWELCGAAVAYWALALLAMWEGGRFRDANPAAVWGLVRREGYRVPLAALLIALAVVVHGRAALVMLEELHHVAASAWLSLLLIWAGQLFCLLFLLRWLGVSRFHAWKRRRKMRARSGSAADDEAVPPTLDKRQRGEQERAPFLTTEG